MFHFADDSENNSPNWKKNPDDFQGLLLQLFLILRNEFFLSVWFLQKQQVAPVANLEFLRNFLGLGVPPMQGWTATKKHGVMRKTREK